MIMKFFSKKKKYSYDELVTLKKKKLEIKFIKFLEVKLLVDYIKI